MQNLKINDTSTSPKEVDVIVASASRNGLVAARSLAQAGLKVLVVEADSISE